MLVETHKTVITINEVILKLLQRIVHCMTTAQRDTIFIQGASACCVDKASHQTAYCTRDSMQSLPITQSLQHSWMMRTAWYIGQNVSWGVSDFA